MHELIAEIIAYKKHRLLPEEIRFLRVHLGFSSKAFAEFIGVTPETITRWEKGKLDIKETSEKFLRVLIISKKGLLGITRLLQTALKRRLKSIKRSLLLK